MFRLDEEIPFGDFVKTIYHHARRYEIKVTDLERQRETVVALLEKAEAEKRKGCYANAYYFVNKCLLFFDKDENQTRLVDNYASLKTVFSAALDMEKDLKEKWLRAEYSAMINEIKMREPERLRLITLQLAEIGGEKGTGGNSLADAGRHNIRQQEVLSRERDNVPQLLQMLHSTTVPGAKPTGVPRPLPAPAPNRATLSPPPQYPQITARPPAQDNYRIPAAVTTNIPESCYLNEGNAVVTVSRRGIVNLGNTCYMNSVLQVLNSTPLGQYFLTDSYVSNLVTTKGSLTRLTNAFSFVLRELNRSDCRFSVSASPLKSALGDYSSSFQNSQQQDASEFLRILLDGVHEALNANGMIKSNYEDIDNSIGTDDVLARKYWKQYHDKNSSVVADYCAFQERSSVTCPNCGVVSRSFSVSLSLELPIPPTSSPVLINDCFAAYCREETLDNRSLYMCHKCKQKVNARKQMLFYSTPQVLFVTLKRFKTQGEFRAASKVSTAVRFGKELDVSRFMCTSFSKTKYHLVGIVNHQGNMHGGHYTADAVGPDDVWCSFSDEVVTKSVKADNQLAYILCYSR
ncbi:ubiquitin carboxyl-terminal hydrolase [Novymonas esmeraldas]|uniref:Ubiquitin carboxyl-terminal hydrolase n=1 Tax=Novymonas esmeraldas TaxID=1808958 RepID=A0AAW0EQP9_9TRYP